MNADPIAPWPLVRRGDTIFPVRPLQQLLRARNHPVAVDGTFGPRPSPQSRPSSRARALRTTASWVR